MPSDVSVPVEQIGEEAVSEVAETRVKRFLFNVRVYDTTGQVITL